MIHQITYLFEQSFNQIYIATLFCLFDLLASKLFGIILACQYFKSRVPDDYSSYCNSKIVLMGSNWVSQLVMGTSQHLFFSLGVQMTSGHVRWNIHVSVRHRGLLPGNDGHVRPGSRKLMFGRHLGEKSRLRRLFFGTIKSKWERHNSPTTAEVCIMCLVDILTRNFRLARLFWNDISQMGEVEQPYNNGGLQHVHQTIYLWIIK